MAGSEVRVFQPGTRQSAGGGLVDGGSGYCSQNAMPVHVGVPATWRKAASTSRSPRLPAAERRVTTFEGRPPTSPHVFAARFG